MKLPFFPFDDNFGFNLRALPFFMSLRALPFFRCLRALPFFRSLRALPFCRSLQALSYCGSLCVLPLHLYLWDMFIYVWDMRYKLRINFIYEPFGNTLLIFHLLTESVWLTIQFIFLFQILIEQVPRPSQLFRPCYLSVNTTFWFWLGVLVSWWRH